MTRIAKTIGDEEIARTLKDYGVSADAGLCDKIRAYISLLLRWNERVALTAVRDPRDILRFHFGESMYGAHIGRIENGRLADLGSGAGFPGIPLSLIRPGLEVMLIEPNLKKSVFLHELKRELGLDSLEVRRDRMEEYAGMPFDTVASRALGDVEALLAFGRRNLKHRGRILLWMGADDVNELVRSHPEWSWSEAVVIPKSERRCIVWGHAN